MKVLWRNFALALVMCGSMAAWAGDLEDADAAIGKKDYATAIRKYKNAAAQGSAYAQSNLASMYYFGKGVVQDYVRAHMWANLAASASVKDGDKKRDAIASFMTPQQIAEAQKMARQCQAKNFKNCD